MTPATVLNVSEARDRLSDLMGRTFYRFIQATGREALQSAIIAAQAKFFTNTGHLQEG